MPKPNYNTPPSFDDYARFGFTEDFILRALSIAYTLLGNKVVSGQKFAMAFGYLQGDMDAQKQRARKTTGMPTKIYLDQPQMVLKRLFELVEIVEKVQEKEQPCSEGDLLIRYIKCLISFYANHNSYYVLIGQNRFVHKYLPRQMEKLDHQIAPTEERGGDRKMAKVTKMLFETLAQRFENLLEQVKDGNRTYAFVTKAYSEEAGDLVQRMLNLFNLWAEPLNIRQGSVVGSNYNRAEAERYRQLLDVESFLVLTTMSGLPAPRSHWALPEFCLATKGNFHQGLKPPSWSDSELKAIKDTIVMILLRRKAALASRLSILVDGNERCSFSLDDTKSVSFQLNKGERLIEVISREAEGDVPLAAHLMDYDPESYDQKRGGEKRLNTTIKLEGGQKVSFVISLNQNADQDVTGATMTVAYRHPNLLRRAARWWEGIRIGDWTPSAMLTPAQAFALAMIVALGLGGLAVYRNRKLNPPSIPIIAKQDPKLPELERKPSPEIQHSREPLQTDRHLIGDEYVSKDGLSGNVPDNLDKAVIEKDRVLLGQAELPSALSQPVREFIEEGFVSPPKEASYSLAAINDQATRGAEEDKNAPVLAFPTHTAVRSNRPTLRWKPVLGAQEYRLKVVDKDGKPVFDDSVGKRTRMTLPMGVIQPGQIYVWGVEATINDRRHLSLPAAFWALSADSLREVAEAERLYPNSALVRASVYEAHGLYDEALAQIERLKKSNPKNLRIQQMLDRLNNRAGKR